MWSLISSKRKEILICSFWSENLQRQNFLWFLAGFWLLFSVLFGGKAMARLRVRRILDYKSSKPYEQLKNYLRCIYLDLLNAKSKFITDKLCAVRKTQNIDR